MTDLVLGIAIFAAAIAIWTVLDRSPLGRIVQALITAAAYAAWLSIIPGSIYFIANDISEAVADERYGTAVFIGLISLTFIPIFLLAILPWNFFCNYVWRKTGLKLPQSKRLAGDRAYYDWERQR